jgi:propionyl-CoA synthetase
VRAWIDTQIAVPMIPAALYAILATVRLGAIHAVVFGGFAPASLAQRIEASKPQVIMTASCGIEGNKKPLAYKAYIEGALEKSSFKPEKVIVWQREQLKWEPVAESKGERHWQELVQAAKKKGVKVDSVPVKSNDGLYIIYTSGESLDPQEVQASGHVGRCSLSPWPYVGVP